MKRFALLFTSILLLVLLSSCISEPELLEKSKVYIVSVGLDYKNTEIEKSEGDVMGTRTQLLALDGAINDALEFSYCLEDIYKLKHISCETINMIARGSNASESNTLLYPSRDNVINIIKGLSVTSNDLIVFYFSGHSGQQYMYLGKTKDEANHTKLYPNELFETLSNKGCASIAILDTCFAGNIVESGTPQQYINQALSCFCRQDFPNVSVLASSNSGQKSQYDSNHQGHGIFTLALLTVMGWNHSSTQVRYLNTGNSIIDVAGFVQTLPEELSVDYIYREIQAIWPEMMHNIPFPVAQNPDITFNHFNFFLVPYVSDSDVPQIPEVDESLVIIISEDGIAHHYKGLQQAIDDICNEAVSGTIRLVADLNIDGENDSFIMELSDTTQQIEIDCGLHTIQFTNNSGIQISGEGHVDITNGSFVDVKTDISDSAEVKIKSSSIKGSLIADNNETKVYIYGGSYDLVELKANDGAHINIIPLAEDQDQFEKPYITVSKVEIGEEAQIDIGNSVMQVTDLEVSGNLSIKETKVEIKNEPTLNENASVSIKDSTLFAEEEVFDSIINSEKTTTQGEVERQDIINQSGFVIELPPDPNKH